jgi:hypothetical protein
MSAALRFVPPRVALVDNRTGLITREWYLFLQGIFERVGGPTGLSTTDVDAGGFAAMQPTSFDACFSDINQATANGGDVAAEVLQGTFGDQFAADVTQLDLSQPTQFWSP